MSKKQVRVYVLIEHHTKDKDAKVLGVYMRYLDALKANRRYKEKALKPRRMSESKKELGYLAILKMPLKGMYMISG
jgi:hypothetical protein